MQGLPAYLVRRLLLLIPTFLIGTSLIFAAIRVLPGDELTLIIRRERGERSDLRSAAATQR